MAYPQYSSLRHVFSTSAPLLRYTQRRWAQVHDVRFLATHPRPDRIIDKYREKLDQKAKEQGLNDIDELKAAYKDKIASLSKKAAVPGATAPLQTQEQTSPQAPQLPFHPPPPPRPANSTVPSPENKAGIKTLSSFIDVGKTLELPQKEIEIIWRLRHARDPHSLSAVIPYDIWDRIQKTAKKHPQFILPLPREGQGAEIHFLQWTFSDTTATVLFTHLAEYKLRGEFSQPHTTVTHHLELAGPKGLVLLQGSVVDGRGITVEEGKWLLMCLQKFYGQTADETPRRRLLEKFTGGDGGFKVEELLEEAEKIS
ncbi:hypothetical protein LTR66_003489 [Elasticomyces elasticus]|nr:hypothetical protein LTR50_000989 [Elasticomyces elasticus]KAK4997032.1 hypothetical protein LTR66_003489 [Elasticomyces elasticus]KAK5006653.1 hypothetical protein LTR28_006234 [Elasticomyces elasticus]